MLRHTEECRTRGYRFVADPSQQLAFADGPFIRRLIDGADYLFTNDYESHIIEQKTGWSQDEIMDRVTTRVIDPRAARLDIYTKGRPIHVGVDDDVARVDPPGRGCLPGGFLTGLSAAWVTSGARSWGPCSRPTSWRRSGRRSTRRAPRPSWTVSRWPTATTLRPRSPACHVPPSPTLPSRRSTPGRAAGTSVPSSRLPNPGRTSSRPGDLDPSTLVDAYRHGLFPWGWASMAGAHRLVVTGPAWRIGARGPARPQVPPEGSQAVRDPDRHRLRRGDGQLR